MKLWAPGMSVSAPNIRKMDDIVNETGEDGQVVFVVGAIAHGKADASYCDAWTSISQYPLSASVCVSRIASAFESLWGII